jgi:hypothetical protein
VTFNAWHYSDDHLWVGLVEHLFRELRDQDPVTDAPGARHMREAQLAELKAQQARLNERLRQVDALDPEHGWWGRFSQVRRSMMVLRAAGAEARSQWHRALWPAVAMLILAVVLGAAALLIGDIVGGWLSGLAWVASALTLLGAVRSRLVAAWTVAQGFTETARARLLADQAKRAGDIAEIEHELTEQDPARKLDRLLSDITDPERYRGYRGLTGRIHHDLRRLSEQLAQARQEDRRALRRIILYVDDLDRCTSHRVVEVLQAVNLLLSMDLFVVVVAVDPRWLIGALAEHHGRLLNATSNTDTDQDSHSEGHGRPLDYLEKVFHVAYAVRPMSQHAADFLRELLPSVAPTQVPRYDTGTHDEQGTWLAADTALLEALTATEASPASRIAGGDIRYSSPGGSPPPGDPAVATPPSDTRKAAGRRPLMPEPQVRSLHIEPQESTFIPRLAELIPTPRGVKKLANTYRLLRISITDEQLPHFLGNPDEGGPYQAAALLLAAIIGSPGHARGLLIDLATGKPDRDIIETLATNSNPLADRLGAFLIANRSDLAIIGATATYQAWARVVARYSFDTYDLFTGQPPA